MEAALHESDQVAFYRIDEPVLSRNTSGPVAFQPVAQRFRLPFPFERISANGVDQFVDFLCDSWLRLEPIAVLFLEPRRSGDRHLSSPQTLLEILRRRERFEPASSSFLDRLLELSRVRRGAEQVSRLAVGPVFLVGLSF